MGRVEDETNVIEGGGHEAARGDVALVVLEIEGGLEREPREERPGAGDKESKLGRVRIVVDLAGDYKVRVEATTVRRS